MKKIAFVSMIIAGFVGMANAAAPVQRRGQSTQSNASAPAQTTSTARAARAVKTATASSANVASASTPTVAARAGSRQRVIATAPKSTGTASTNSAAPAVTARAGAKQKVISTGTKVATATQNTVVSDECQQKYMGCMDSFCMIDNASGGRCICSDKNAEFNSILAEIEKLDAQSYKMATTGVEQIEMGDDADAAIAKANAVAASLTSEKQSSTDGNKTVRKALDLSAWNTPIDLDEDDVFDDFANDNEDTIDGKEGDALYAAATKLCRAQIPECSADMSMLRMMYSQRIKSDCTAYENTLKQQKSASATKLATAEKALREAALEQYRSANKYDLGQCTVEFKKCMTTTAGCGDDFSKCVSVSLSNQNTDNIKSTASRRARSATSYSIKGASSTVEIAAGSYDALMAKKPLCESVTKQCTNVASQVWDTFLREVAPQIKAAELAVEDDNRQNCVGNISACFQKACKDNMDPNDEEGSYDMCLSRPGTMLNVCKIPLNNCGISAESETAAESHPIWNFVVARLASMRVDACTKEVKACMQDEDRCGKDYTQCIGLDTDTIVRMCPYDKLTGCQKIYNGEEIKGEEVYDKIASMIQGLLLNIDNNMLSQCQKAAQAAMVKVCGDSDTCAGMTTDENLGARSLEYKICEYKKQKDGTYKVDMNTCKNDVSLISDAELKAGRIFAGMLNGTMYWEHVNINSDGTLTSSKEYLKSLGVSDTESDTGEDVIKSELEVLRKNIDTVVSAIESDSMVQYCMTGRQVQGMRVKNKDGETKRQQIGADENGNIEGRFPELTQQMRMTIANATLKKAKDNYYKKYDELNEKMTADAVKLSERMDVISGQADKEAHITDAHKSCVGFAKASALPRTSTALEKTAVLCARQYWLVRCSEDTITKLIKREQDLQNASLAATENLPLVGTQQTNEWNYKETVTSTFNRDTLICHKCIKAQTCKTPKRANTSSRYCKEWNDPTETCTDTQF